MTLEYRVKILVSQVAVKLLNLCFVWRIGVTTLTLELLKIFFRLLQMIKVIVLHVSATQLIGELVLHDVLRLRLHYRDYETSPLFVKGSKLILLLDKLLLNAFQIASPNLVFLVFWVNVLGRIVLMLHLLQANVVDDHLV